MMSACVRPSKYSSRHMYRMVTMVLNKYIVRSMDDGPVVFDPID
jgi:hypothetical protein